VTLTGAKPKAKKSGEAAARRARRGVYQPDRGDIVYLNFTPQAGHEQAGRRPALVLSPVDFNVGTGLVMVCPITNTRRGSPFEVEVPRGSKLSGVILTHHMRSADWVARQAELHGTVPEATILEVLARVEAILQIALVP